MAIFKRNAKIGNAQANTIHVLEELVDNFTVLITASGFLEVCLEAPLRNFGGFTDSGAERERNEATYRAETTLHLIECPFETFEI